ncbi:MAG TPA: MFS transporter [Chloroflexia bacterium]|nr:MFS transporter [Chloroflexia bacterium]
MERNPAGAAGARRLAEIPRLGIVLALVGFLAELGGAMIVPIRFVFLVGVLSVSLPLAGGIESLAAAGGTLMRVLARLIPGSRRPPRFAALLLGYFLSHASRPLLALAGSGPQALGLALLDRLGRGIQGPARDTLLAEGTPPAVQPQTFALHRVLVTLGATAGSLVTAAILTNTAGDLRAVFLWTAVPGVLSLLLCLAARPTPLPAAPLLPDAPPPPPTALRIPHSALRTPHSVLGLRFWMFTVTATLFALGSVPAAFPLFYALGLTHTLSSLPLLYGIYVVTYTLLVTPLGVLSDRQGPVPVLVVGYAAFGLIHAGWGLATQPWQPWALFILYGIYAAATEGVGRGLARELAPDAGPAAALAWYDGLTATATLLAGLLGGLLWSAYGPGATFGYAAWLGLAASFLLGVWGPWLRGVRPLPAAESP